MSKPLSERMSEFEISLVNEPLDLTSYFEVEPLTAIERARRRWGKASVSERSQT